MKKSKLERWIVKILKIIGLLSFFIVAMAILVIGFFMVWDSKYLQNTVVFNQITLYIGILSLPGAFITLVEISNNRKKEFIATTKCPNCKHLIELKIEQKD
ncbi:hypothetical protein [Brevibacillus laterosporus]|uniref:hypothetical protein n=1 Tax=Brevibacillus laterosporus TaxID=1465 RepID=UPI0003B1D0D2|nr:hypothetical protein [Brevibacillus laterosporus]ERM16531.1 hypothetical protein P615_23230 [Brevibacillus laterosporus PE36]